MAYSYPQSIVWLITEDLEITFALIENYTRQRWTSTLQFYAVSMLNTYIYFLWNICEEFIVTILTVYLKLLLTYINNNNREQTSSCKGPLNSRLAAIFFACASVTPLLISMGYCDEKKDYNNWLKFIITIHITHNQKPINFCSLVWNVKYKCHHNKISLNYDNVEYTV